MFITTVLCLKRIKWVPAVRPRGHLYRGKYRWVRKVEQSEVQQTIEDLEIEERNMFYLRHPYLTRSEYKNVGRDFVKTNEKRLQLYRDQKIEKFSKTIGPRTIESFFFNRLRKTNNWE